MAASKSKRRAKAAASSILLLLPLVLLAAVTLLCLVISHPSLLLHARTSSKEPQSSRESQLRIPTPPAAFSADHSTREEYLMTWNTTTYFQPEDNFNCSGPYHNWNLFALDFKDMINNFKIFVYPHVSSQSTPFSRFFLPHPDPFDLKLGNYFSEHMFKINLLRSSLLTSRPEDAHFFFMPFSINALRNDPRVHSEASIADFVAQYTMSISREFGFWNASGGSDHFYVCCHSVCRDAASKHPHLQNNAIQITCSSSYFQRLYVAHKDVGLPQVWPRPLEKVINPPNARTRLLFFAGRTKNSRVREQLISMWGNDTSMDISSGNLAFPYEEGFRRSRYCLHVKGYEVNTARISDALHYGCIPVIISNHYDLPFANVLDWSKFSVVINHGDIASLKKILLSISRHMYINMYRNLCQVRVHFQWHLTPRDYDSFHMTAYQLWSRRGMHLSS